MAKNNIHKEDINKMARKSYKKDLELLYADDQSTNRRYNRTSGGRIRTLDNAADVRSLLVKATANKEEAVKASKQLYATNPIYASVIDYMSNMFMWRYKVVPHKVYTKSKAKAKKSVPIEDYNLMYNLMLEVVDGLTFETKMPTLLSMLFTQGALFLTTYCDDETYAINTLVLPDKYCKKIAETQFGTSIISFDYSYFDSLGLNEKDLKDYLTSFPKEFQKGYKAYTRDNNLRWQQLDPHFSSGFMMNESGIPTYLYILGGILDYEHYQDNEVERSDNSLKYLVVHTMPHYEDQLIFEVDEVAAVHRSLKRIVDTGEKARLITTYGDVHVENIGDDAQAEADTLSKSFKAIFNNAGFNSGIFTSESVEALKMSLIRDKGIVWKYVQTFVSFYNIVVNNYFDFKGYEADIDILPISPYTYNEDIKVYKDNATLGVGKLDYLIASGTKQRNIADSFELESFLKLERITPMQTSYTQTADDREVADGKDSKESKESDGKDSEIEPSDSKTKDSKDSKDSGVK